MNVENSVREQAVQLGKRAKVAARQLAPLPSEEKNSALLLMADALEDRADFLLQENQKRFRGSKEKRNLRRGARSDRLEPEPHTGDGQRFARSRRAS